MLPEVEAMACHSVADHERGRDILFIQTLDVAFEQFKDAS